MAYSEDDAQIFRDALAHITGVTEKKMFGGLCFMLRDHMLCGVANDGGMARVGPDHQSAALELDGIEPLSFTGKPMKGFVDVSFDAMLNEPTRTTVLNMAIDYVNSLPPKKPKPKKPKAKKRQTKKTSAKKSTKRKP